MLEIPDGVYGTAGIVVFDQQRAPSRRTFLRLAFPASFEPFIEFSGNTCVRGPDYLAPDGDVCILDPVTPVGMPMLL
jgi:hypothetical protein